MTGQGGLEPRPAALGACVLPSAGQAGGCAAASPGPRRGPRFYAAEATAAPRREGDRAFGVSRFCLSCKHKEPHVLLFWVSQSSQNKYLPSNATTVISINSNALQGRFPHTRQAQKWSRACVWSVWIMISVGSLPLGIGRSKAAESWASGFSDSIQATAQRTRTSTQPWLLCL